MNKVISGQGQYKNADKLTRTSIFEKRSRIVFNISTTYLGLS